jgi:hypothetical protein
VGVWRAVLQRFHCGLRVVHEGGSSSFGRWGACHVLVQFAAFAPLLLGRWGVAYLLAFGGGVRRRVVLPAWPVRDIQLGAVTDTTARFSLHRSFQRDSVSSTGGVQLHAMYNTIVCMKQSLIECKTDSLLPSCGSQRTTPTTTTTTPVPPYAAAARTCADEPRPAQPPPPTQQRALEGAPPAPAALPRPAW